MRNLRTLIIPVALGLNPDQITALMEANGFVFTSRQCPFILAKPCMVDYDAEQRAVTYAQWDVAEEAPAEGG